MTAIDGRGNTLTVGDIVCVSSPRTLKFVWARVLDVHQLWDNSFEVVVALEAWAHADDAFNRWVLPATLVLWVTSDYKNLLDRYVYDIFGSGPTVKLETSGKK